MSAAGDAAAFTMNDLIPLTAVVLEARMANLAAETVCTASRAAAGHARRGDALSTAEAVACAEQAAERAAERVAAGVAIEKHAQAPELWAYERMALKFATYNAERARAVVAVATLAATLVEVGAEAGGWAPEQAAKAAGWVGAPDAPKAVTSAAERTKEQTADTMREATAAMANAIDALADQAQAIANVECIAEAKLGEIAQRAVDKAPAQNAPS